MLRSALLIVGALAAFAACSSQQQAAGNGAGPNGSPSASGTITAYDTTNSQPQNCVQKTEDFRYFDTLTNQPMAWLQSYTPYPLTNRIRFYTAIPTSSPIAGAGTGPPTPIDVEVPPGAPVPKGTNVYQAAPAVPVIDWVLVYGLEDNATVIVIPRGTIADAYETDIQYRATQQNDAEMMANSLHNGGNPTPIPTDSAAAALDAQFQTVGLPAVGAISRGANPDDAMYKGLNEPDGTPVQSADPHPRIATCNWLQNRAYDLVATIIRKRKLSASVYSTIASGLQAQNAPTSMVTAAQWVAYEKDTYLIKNVQPQLWLPWQAQATQQGDQTAALFNAVAYPFPAPLATVQLPTPDQT